MCRQCDCDSSNTTCQCGNRSREHLLSITAKFTTISAIIASPDGVLNIADQVYDFYSFCKGNKFNCRYKIIG